LQHTWAAAGSWKRELAECFEKEFAGREFAAQFVFFNILATRPNKRILTTANFTTRASSSGADAFWQGQVLAGPTPRYRQTRYASPSP